MTKLIGFKKLTEFILSFLSKNGKLFTMFGIDFSVNCSVAILPIALVAGGNVFCWMAYVYLLEIVATIVIHEGGHALAGYFLGNPAVEICIMGCGGYTTFSRSLGVTLKDAVISLSGPLANGMIVLGIICFEMGVWGGPLGVWTHFIFEDLIFEDLSFDDMPYCFVVLNSIAYLNAYMFFFNLLPAFPLDGGRILRCVLGTVLSPTKAAFSTMFVARVLSILLVVWAVATNFVHDFNFINFAICMIISLFIWHGSKIEFWRTKIYCAAEAGSAYARSVILELFGEDIKPLAV